VVNTSDKDNASAHHDKVKNYTFPWCDDFSAARNFAQSKCTKDWILWLDDDDIIHATSAKLISAAIRCPGPKTFMKSCYFSFVIKNQTEDEEGTVHVQVRLYPNGEGAEWDGSIHEDISRSLMNRQFPMIVVDNIEITHTGYNDPETTIKKIKERNIPMLLKEKDSPQKSFNLANSYTSIGEPDKALECLENLVIDNPHIVTLSSEFTEAVNFEIAKIYYEKKQLEEAKKRLIMVTRPEAIFYRADISYLEGDIKRAGHLFEHFLEQPSFYCHWGSNQKRLRYWAYMRLAKFAHTSLQIIQARAKEEFPTQPKWRKS